LADLPTSIRLPPKLKAELAKRAKAQASRVSVLVVHILQSWVDYMKSQDAKK
jgi:hypothetical protein